MMPFADSLGRRRAAALDEGAGSGATAVAPAQSGATDAESGDRSLDRTFNFGGHRGACYGFWPMVLRDEPEAL